MSNEKCILLVEDNPDHAALALRALRRAEVDNEVVVMEDGEHALSFLDARAQRDLPTVVLLDLNLPGISGHEVLRHIRQTAQLQTLPVVILSTSDEEQDKVLSYQLGANSYMLKPVEFDDFVCMASCFSQYWLKFNQQCH